MGLIRFLLRGLGGLLKPLFGAAFEELDDGSSRFSQTEGSVATGAFRDAARGRTIPFKLYFPDDSETGDAPEAPHPVVIFSHGLGGSRDAAPYLGEALAQNGYYAFFIQHPGTDQSVLEGATSGEDVRERLKAVTMNPASGPDRFRDVHAVIDQMQVMNREGRLAGKLDLTRIGMAGHSFGARGVLTAAGQRMGPYGAPFKEPRVRAGIALSPNLPNQMMPGQSPQMIYNLIDIPVFHMTGTEDGMPLGEGGAGPGGPGANFDPTTRTLPYQYTPASDQYLLVLDGAHHNTFSSRLRNIDDIDPSEELPNANMGGRGEVRHVQAVAMGAVMFFDAYLKEDASALKMLKGGFSQTLEPGDRFEFK